MFASKINCDKCSAEHLKNALIGIKFINKWKVMQTYFIFKP